MTLRRGQAGLNQTEQTATGTTVNKGSFHARGQSAAGRGPNALQPKAEPAYISAVLDEAYGAGRGALDALGEAVTARVNKSANFSPEAIESAAADTFQETYGTPLDSYLEAWDESHPNVRQYIDELLTGRSITHDEEPESNLVEGILDGHVKDVAYDRAFYTRPEGDEYEVASEFMLVTENEPDEAGRAALANLAAYAFSATQHSYGNEPLGQASLSEHSGLTGVAFTMRHGVEFGSKHRPSFDEFEETLEKYIAEGTPERQDPNGARIKIRPGHARAMDAITGLGRVRLLLRPER